jgi:hypothetical protein
MDYALPGKHFQLKNGELEKYIVGQTIQAKVEVRKYDTLDDLGADLRRMTPEQYLTAGIPSVDVGLCVSKSREVALYAAGGEEPGSHKGLAVITRTEDHLPFPRGAGLMLIDNDGEYDLDAVLQKAQPEVLEHKFLDKASSSGCIFDADGNELKPRTGGHRFWHVKDATDIPRVLQTLHVRAILAGFDESRIGEAGQFLERSSVDRAMKVPCQPIFIRAHCKDGLQQRMDITVSNGIEVLDTKAVIADLTEDEEAEYNRLVSARMASLAPEADRKRLEFVQGRVQDLLDRGVPETRAQETILTAMEGKPLHADFELILAGGKRITVRDVLANREQYHGLNCRDPLEPSYGGDTTAIIYTNKAPMVRSLSHGVPTTFKLTSQEAADPMQKDQARLVSVMAHLSTEYVLQAQQRAVGEDRPVPTWRRNRMRTAVTRDQLKHATSLNPLVMEPLVPVMQGQLTYFFGMPGSGKTAMAMEVAALCAELGMEVDYYNLDAPLSDLAVYHQMAETGGFCLHSLLADGVTIDKMRDTLISMGRDSRPGELKNNVVILDVYKHFARDRNVNDKTGNVEVLGWCRDITRKGGTVIVLGHAIKSRDHDTGRPIWAGTQDMEDDVDSMWCIDHAEMEESRQIHANVLKVKARHRYSDNWAYTVFRGESLINNAVDLTAEYTADVDEHNRAKELRHEKAGHVALVLNALTAAGQPLNQTQLVNAVREMAEKEGQTPPGITATKSLIRALDGEDWIGKDDPAQNNARFYRLNSQRPRLVADVLAEHKVTG